MNSVWGHHIWGWGSSNSNYVCTVVVVCISPLARFIVSETLYNTHQIRLDLLNGLSYHGAEPDLVAAGLLPVVAFAASGAGGDSDGVMMRERQDLALLRALPIVPTAVHLMLRLPPMLLPVASQSPVPSLRGTRRMATDGSPLPLPLP